jgi:uncharacterized membrane protein (UPF0136 family)
MQSNLPLLRKPNTTILNMMSISILLFCYGLFLILCGITSVIFIGLKAKTALASGGLSGLTAITMAYLVHNQSNFAAIAGIVLTLLLFAVFAWRSTKTLFKILELISTQHADLKGKVIAFLIISLMAVVSLSVCLLQVAVYFG